eukprot:757858-Hanusia_phi.AAC.1
MPPCKSPHPSLLVQPGFPLLTYFALLELNPLAMTMFSFCLLSTFSSLLLLLPPLLPPSTRFIPYRTCSSYPHPPTIPQDESCRSAATGPAGTLMPGLSTRWLTQ